MKLQYFGYLMQRANSLEKTVMLGKIEGRRKSGATEDEMVGWHHGLNEHGLEQAPGDGEGQGKLACCSPWSHKESDTTEQLNTTTSEWPQMAQLPLMSCVTLGMTLRLSEPLLLCLEKRL